MIGFSDEGVLFAARLGFLVGYGASAGCLAFGWLWVLRRLGLRAQRPGAWRRDSLLAFATAVVVGVTGWFVRPSPPSSFVTVPAGARLYRAIATNDAWTFEHPGDPTFVSGVLWVEAGAPVQLLLQVAPEVSAPRCFAVPTMRLHRDAIPDRDQSLWFIPTALGDFPVEPSPDCPVAAGSPRAIVRVVDSDTWARAPWR